MIQESEEYFWMPEYWPLPSVDISRRSSQTSSWFLGFERVYPTFDERLEAGFKALSDWAYEDESL